LTGPVDDDVDVDDDDDDDAEAPTPTTTGSFDGSRNPLASLICIAVKPPGY
jgi:hypothetical protein